MLLFFPSLPPFLLSFLLSFQKLLCASIQDSLAQGKTTATTTHEKWTTMLCRDQPQSPNQVQGTWMTWETSAARGAQERLLGGGS